jgi:hypothetical protein
MFYVFSYIVTSSDTKDNPHILEMNLSAGVIHQVDILFQKDCQHKINVQIFYGLQQLWPSNPGGSLKGDATIISFREFFELSAQRNDLIAKIWTDDTGVLKEVIIQIGVLPKRILQPLSFEELLKAATAIE